MGPPGLCMGGRAGCPSNRKVAVPIYPVKGRELEVAADSTPGRPLTCVKSSSTNAACLGRVQRGGTNVSVQGDRLLVQTDVWLFIRLQHVLHLGDVVFVEIGHHPHFFPATA